MVIPGSRKGVTVRVGFIVKFSIMAKDNVRFTTFRYSNWGNELLRCGDTNAGTNSN